MMSNESINPTETVFFADPPGLFAHLLESLLPAYSASTSQCWTPRSDWQHYRCLIFPEPLRSSPIDLLKEPFSWLQILGPRCPCRGI